MAFNVADAVDYLDKEWTNSVIPELKKYIAIENTSLNFSYNITEARKAAHLLKEWAGKRGIPNIKAEVHDTYDTDGRAPLVLVTIEGTKANPADVFIYGHYDKQPPSEGWVKPHDHPYIPYEDPVTKRLYGRGGADDGYSIFAAITSIEVLWKQNIPHDRYVILIEGAEESSSKGLEQYLEEFADIIRTPSLVVCLDSGCGNYDQLWLTTSLRGIVNGSLSVSILTEAAHSGSASGIVASSFHIQRTLMDRLSDHAGVIHFNKLTQEITEGIKNQAKNLAELLGETIYNKFSYVEHGQPVDKANIDTMIINNTYRPSLCVIGVGTDIPLIGSGDTGNVVRKGTTFLLSVRLPPAKDATQAAADLKAELERDPPYGATVRYELDGLPGSGWQASTDLGWLQAALTNANHNFFDKTKDFVTQGEGGSIPFIGLLASKFQQAKFVVTGVLGPGSNAHGPNEFLDTIFAKKVTGSVANILYELSLQK